MKVVDVEVVSTEPGVVDALVAAVVSGDADVVVSVLVVVAIVVVVVVEVAAVGRSVG